MEAVERRPRVLVFSYAVEPDRGSEPGAGWGLVTATGSWADCVVLTGPEHMESIRRWESQHPDNSLEFLEVPEPWWGRFAKWHRITWFLLYAVWLRRAAGTAKKLLTVGRFDAVHHATYSAYWIPTPAVRLGLPSVWGPVGGAVTTPWRLWRLLGWRGIPGEVLDLLATRLLASMPSTRRAWRAASLLIAQNEQTLRRLPRDSQTVLLNHALLTQAPEATKVERGNHLLWVSAMEPRKGPRLAIRALAATPDDVRLLMVGDGSERKALERLSRRLRVSHRIDFRGWVPRQEVIELLAGCAAAVFTGLREEGGLALAEAMLTGTPVIVLGHGGARAIASASTDPTRVALIEPKTTTETVRRMAEAMTRSSRKPCQKTMPSLDQPQAAEALKVCFQDAMDRASPHE